MTDKFDILIFIYEQHVHAEKVTWSTLLKHFVDEAPPYRRISKRTLHLWLLELIEEGYIEKIIDKKTLGPCYNITSRGISIARKKKVEREWIEEVKKATEKTLLHYLETSEDALDYASIEAERLYEVYQKILQDVFGLTQTEFEVLHKLYLNRKEEGKSKLSSYEGYEGFYFWLKNREYENLLKDLEIRAKWGVAVEDLEILKKVIERTKKT